jgi:hypothetical protein
LLDFLLLFFIKNLKTKRPLKYKKISSLKTDVDKIFEIKKGTPY